MASLDQLKGTFFDECSEALQQIELGLSDLREGTASDDTINAVFRSVHSVKGGAGIFGFDDLVKFAHVLETVLDAMRSGKMPSSQDIVDTLLQANDVLSDLIGMSRSGEAIPSDYGSECRVGLERILQANSPGDEWGAGGSDDMADFEGIDFVPVRADEFDSEDHPPAEQEYRIVFRPKPELLKKANEPLYILRELRRARNAGTQRRDRKAAAVDGVGVGPALSRLDRDAANVHAGRADSRSLEFVLDDCELEISAVEAVFDSPPFDMPADTSSREAASAATRRRRGRRRADIRAGDEQPAAGAEYAN